MERVMIEGGASVIKSCLSSFDMLDAVVVTIAPTWIGKGITIQNSLSKEVSDLFGISKRTVNSYKLTYTTP